VTLNLTKHAREQMEDRGITRAEIEAVLADPHDSIAGSQPNTIRYIGHVGVSARQLNVVLPWPGVAVEPYKVVTVYWE
jgi:hypothetical protein